MQVSRETLELLQSCTSLESKNQTSCSQLYAQRILEKLQACNSVTIDCRLKSATNNDVHLEQFCELSGLTITGANIKNLKGLQHLSTHLKYLVISRCHITINELLSRCLDESLPLSWPCLLALKMSHCKLNDLDDSLKLLPILQELDLSFNNLTNTEQYLSLLDCLTHLNLSFNQLQKFPQLRSSVSWRLRVLNISYNELSNLEGVNHLEGLTELYASNNLLLHHKNLQVLRTLHNLKRVSLNGNPLSHVKNHRILCLRNVAPTALNPNFVLDGKKINKKELKILMYTPTAISVINSLYPSINAAENYDVSMSSAVGTSRRFSDYVVFKSPQKKSMHRRRLSKPSRKVIKSTPKVKNENVSTENLLDSTEESIKFIEPGMISLETSHEEELYSAMESDAEFEKDSESIDCSSPNSFRSQEEDGLTESNQISSEYSDTGVTDYYSPLEEPSVYDTNRVESSGEVARQQSDTDECTRDESQLLEQETIVDESIDADEDVTAEITPQLHVRREIIGDLDTPNFEAEEFYIAITNKYLLERDMDTGKVVEKLELSAVSEINLDKMKGTHALDVKFSYLRRDRRHRSYIVLDRGADQAVNQLYSELDGILLHNRSLQSRSYVCLKCSRTFVSEPPSAYGSGLDSYAFQGGQFSPGAIYGLGTSSLHQDRPTTSAPQQPVTCVCGSDMIMETDRQIMTKPSLFSIDEEAADALEGATGKQLNRAGSMAWIGGLSSVNEAMENAANALHVSGSLPSNLASVVMKPVDSDSKNQEIALSTPSVDVTAPFKTFSHLLTPHDLYKLVNVTPSASVMLSANPLLQAQAHNKNMFETPALEHRHMRENKMQQRVVTSTPRRKHPGEGNEMSEQDFSYKGVSHIDTMKTSRALNFTKSFSTALTKIEYYPAEKNNESDNELGIRSEPQIPPSLLHFIEDELLDPGEDLVAAVQTFIASTSGRNLTSYANAAKKSTKKNLFASPQAKPGSPKKSAFIGREIECLLLLTTVNVHILKITSKISGMLTPDILECVSMHPLSQLSKLETGLCDSALYFAIGEANDKKKNMTVDNLNMVYSVNVRSSEKCKRLHSVWNETIYSGFTSDYQSDISAKNVAAQNAFSDALEKEFSEHVLLFLDLNVLTVTDENTQTILTDRLFNFFPCWILNDNCEESATNIVLSCGGSLALFSEDQGIILNEYARAICRTTSRRNTGTSRDRTSSINSNSSQRSWVSPMQQNSPLTPSFTHNVYSTIMQRHCRDVTNAWMFRDNPLTILLSFNDLCDAGDWQITFPCEATFREFTDYVVSYKFVLSESKLDIQWK